MDEVFHSRFTSFVLLGTFVVTTMIVFGYVGRTWSYKHSQDDGAFGNVARGILSTTG